MKAVPLALLLLAACAPVPPPPPPPGTLSGAEGPAFDAAKTRQDLESSARTQFGDASTDEALAAPAFLIAKRYAGMLPPPPPGAGADYRYPDPPAFILVRRDGRWLAAQKGGGFVSLAADKAARLDAALADPGYWKEPVWAPPGCTDAGASLVWLKLPGRPAQVRSGTCGATERTERLVSILLDP
jgi:hypothetical protein